MALERRWEAARRALQTAEGAYAQRGQHTDTAAAVLSPELRTAFLDIGRTLPALGPTDVLAQPQRKALLR